MVFLGGEAKLLQVVLALRPIGGFARGLDRGHDQGDQNGDDGDDDEQLDQGEGRSRPETVRFRAHQSSLGHQAIGQPRGSATSLKSRVHDPIHLAIALARFLRSIPESAVHGRSIRASSTTTVRL